MKLSGAATATDDKDDPSLIDTIFLADPADIPALSTPGIHVSAVHPTIIVHLPRFGDEIGLIPDTPAGHLFYDWLAAFNQTNYSALRSSLPNVALGAQIQLREKTGGLTVLSAEEVQPSGAGCVTPRAGISVPSFAVQMADPVRGGEFIEKVTRLRCSVLVHCNL